MGEMMPIKYSVSNDGHFIHAVAEGTVTDEEFTDYEVTHATDSRVEAPCYELFEISYGSLDQVTPQAIEKALELRNTLNRAHIPHNCAIVVSCYDGVAWDLAKLYEGMAMLHTPCHVVVFGDVGTARIWLGVDSGQSPNR
jgi:hypothetical protein